MSILLPLGLLIFGGNIGAILLFIVGVAVVLAITYAILQRLGVPQNWLVIGMLIVLLIVAIAVFFGGSISTGGGSVIVR